MRGLSGGLGVLVFVWLVGWLVRCGWKGGEVRGRCLPDSTDHCSVGTIAVGGALETACRMVLGSVLGFGVALSGGGSGAAMIDYLLIFCASWVIGRGASVGG